MERLLARFHTSGGLGESAQLSVGPQVYNLPLPEAIYVHRESANLLEMLSNAPETVAITYNELGVSMSPLAIAVLTGISVFSGKNIYSPVDIPMELSFHHSKLFPHRKDASPELGSFRENIARFIHGQANFQSQRDSGDLRRIQNVGEYNRLESLDDALTKNSEVICRVHLQNELETRVRQVKGILPDYDYKLPDPILARDWVGTISNQECFEFVEGFKNTPDELADPVLARDLVGPISNQECFEFLEGLKND